MAAATSWPVLTIAINLAAWSVSERVRFLAHTTRRHHLLVNVHVPPLETSDEAKEADKEASLPEDVLSFGTHWAPATQQGSRRLVGNRGLQMLQSLTQHRRVYIDVRAACVRTRQADEVHRLLDGYYLSCTTQPFVADNDVATTAFSPALPSEPPVQLPHVYYVNGSISSWRVLMALHAKHMPFTAQRLRVMCEPKQTRTAEFLAINPRGKAPVLIDPSGTIVCNSLAILLHLEQDAPTTAVSGDMLSKLLETDQVGGGEHSLVRSFLPFTP
jgi:hypothetical protein